MKAGDLFDEIVGTYQKHGWQLRRALLTPTTRAELASPSELFKSAQVVESTVDALWFSRPSHEEREAWELRLLSENPYALFETFERDETEEQREEMRSDMEARLRDYVIK
jgi:hypothetical protein